MTDKLIAAAEHFIVAWDSLTTADLELAEPFVEALRQALAEPEDLDGQNAINWHHPECEGACLACLIEGVVKTEFGLSGLNYLLKRLDQLPDTTKMIDTGIDRGAWSDVPDATKWVDELRGDDEEPPTDSQIIAGAIYDFAGFLTTREKVIKVGASADAAPVADLVKEWAAMRELLLDDAAVLWWKDVLEVPPLSTTDVVEREGCIVGIKGSAYAPIDTKRAYTYANQPGNVVAYKLGRASSSANLQRAGDFIDSGLILLKELQVEGYGVFDIGAEYIAQPNSTTDVVEPMGEIVEAHGLVGVSIPEMPPVGTKLYTEPPKREWVGLTDEEIGELYRAGWANNTGFARAIEAKLKEKNGG